MDINHLPWSNYLIDSPCFIIAEAGINHNGNLAMALKLVDSALEAGADAVKFQLYNAKEQISTFSTTASYQKQATGTSSMLEMAKSYELSWDNHRKIIEYCHNVGIKYIASCFDFTAIDFYRQIGGEIIKIASGEITNIDLIEYAAKTSMPIILSTGMSTLPEITYATEIIRRVSKSPLALLHCVSIYPTPISELNLNFIKTLSEAFNLPIGLSDHTQSLDVGAWSVTRGAVIVEKHFTLDKSLVGPDHAMSCSPQELKFYVKKIRDAQIALGSFQKKLSKEEIEVRDVARRSIFAARNLPEGTVITEDDLTVKRPGTGISPTMKNRLIGLRTKKLIKSGQLLTWTDV
jgi:N,N'-diacetyllegionaminate synthase